MTESLPSRLKASYRRHERWVPIVAFVCGFVFDMTLLQRIDEPKVMVQQAAYLVLAAVLLTVDLFELLTPITAPFLLRKVWGYREFLLHFMLGTLLNSYTIFYFKSASGITSFIFIFLLVAALTLSEFKKFGQSQRQVHMALWSLCLISYCQTLLPILLGFINTFAFLCSTLAALLAFAMFYKLIRPKFTEHHHPEFLKTQVAYPYILVQILFAAMYFTHAIPPVPLSVSYMGIFHQVEKKDGEYLLSYNRPGYLFWEHGDETFEARPGDAVIAFVQVFLPSGFKQQLNVRWSLDDAKRGWQTQDSIPLNLTGGREEGFRATVYKNNYQPGKWRIQIETEDAREVGRLTFHIEADDSQDPREFKIETR
jgi:hypothetical protein